MHIFTEESPGHFRLTGASGDDVVVEAPRFRSAGGMVRLSVASIVSGIRTTAWLLASEATVIGQRLVDCAAAVDTSGEEE